MTLYMIGIGLWDEKDITLKGLELVKACKKVFLESYTSRLVGADAKKLEKLYGKEVIPADRDMVEKRAYEILEPAREKEIAFLVIGDVFGATTHTDIRLRAKKEGIRVVVVNNASILNAVGIVGLEMYKYGKTTSIPFHNKDVEAPYDVIKQNKKNKMHTLCLLDINAENNGFMTVKQAIEYLLKVEEKRKEKIFTNQTKCIGVARLGSEDPRIVYAKAEKLMNIDLGKALHSLIVPSELHFVEEEALSQWKNI